MRRMNPIYFAGWVFFRLLFAAVFRWRVHNPERVPLEGPVLLASNHASYLDPPLVGAKLGRPVYFLARDTLFRFPVIGSLLRAWNAVPVDREGSSTGGLRAILEKLGAGQAVVLFPEGTRSRDGQLQRARSGVGLIVVRSNAPVVPVRVFGSFEAYGRRHRVPRPRRIDVKYGRPLRFEQLRAEARQCSKARLKEIYQEISEQIMAAIAELQPETDRESFPHSH